MAVTWLDKPEAHDYAAAESYLSLLLPEREAAARVRELREYGQEREYAAKDILRASGLALLPEDNKHVVRDLGKIRRGEKLSPILLIRGELGEHPLIVADGYHRAVASYWTDENTPIPVVIA